MRKNLIKIVILGTIGMASFLFNNTPLDADVYSQFQSIETSVYGFFKVYTTTDPGYTPFTDGRGTTTNQFNIYPNARPDTALDDGYAEIDLSAGPLGFTYRYNNENFTKLYVSINGFVTFGNIQEGTGYRPPSGTNVRNPIGLFETRLDGSYAGNVIAPYWGNHKYWSNIVENVDRGRAPSEIGYYRFRYTYNQPGSVYDGKQYNAIIIQWKDLNVNYQDTSYVQGTMVFDTLLGNVATFQLVIYEGPDQTVAQQGNVEFRYNEFGPTKAQRDRPDFVTAIKNRLKPAAVGIKGISTIGNNKADYVNALYCGGSTEYPQNTYMQQNYPVLADRWPPSGNATLSILLRALHSIAGDEIWGDGDADMSKAPGGVNYGTIYQTDQKRYVTMNDVRTIMLATVTGKKLDSTYRQAAYHADVNHDGRFYYLSSDKAAIFKSDGGVFVTDYDNKYFSEYMEDANGQLILENGQRIPNPDYDPDYNRNNISRDTFFLRKINNLNDKFGFKEHWGTNAEYIEIDFTNLPLGTPLQIQDRVRKYKVIDVTHNVVGGDIDPSETDVLIRIAVIDNGIYYDRPANRTDRDLLSIASGNDYNRPNSEGIINFRLKKNIYWADMFVEEVDRNLPGITDIYKDIYYETNELDASLIMSWLGAQISTLPWIWDNPDHDRKKATDISPYKNATNIAFNNEKVDGDNIVLPIYFNGIAERNQAVKFNFNADVLNIENANTNVKVEFSNETKTAVIISDGYFNPNTPIAYVTLPNNVNTFDATNVRFYGKNADNVSYKLAKVNISDAMNNKTLSNNPNPADVSTEISVNITEAGNYKIAIYDNNGNLISEVTNSNFNVGTYNFTWDCSKIVSGTYLCVLEGANVYVTKSLVIAR